MTQPKSPPIGGGPVVALVGGGASATLTTVNLLLGGPHREGHGELAGDRGAGDGGAAVAPPRVILIDRYGLHGRGPAYATADPDHLLNTPAAKMSAFESDPDHLVRWARAQGWTITGADFLPRAVYGRYLRALLDEAGRRRPAGSLTKVTGTVTSLSPTAGNRAWELKLADGRAIEADAVVVATGNRPPAPVAAWPRSGRCVTDPWEPGALDRIADGEDVLIIGTGLTMADVAITLSRSRPRSVVYAVSRHGLLPQSHLCPAPPPAGLAVPEGEVTLAGLMRAVHQAVVANGGEWQGVIDALRPHIPDLWGRLSPGDKRTFLALVARHWEVHRHRMPPATAGRVDLLRRSGRLRVLSGRLVSVRQQEDDIVVRIGETRIEGSGRTGATQDGRYHDSLELRVGGLVNATGPGADLHQDAFIDALCRAGVARPDPLGLGLDADITGALLDANGRPHHNLFTLGPTLRGLRYETTAIREIRAQAADLAARLSTLGTPSLTTTTGFTDEHH